MVAENVPRGCSAAEPLGENFVNVALDAREVNEGIFGMIPPEETWKLTAPDANGGCGSAFA